MLLALGLLRSCVDIAKACDSLEELEVFSPEEEQAQVEVFNVVNYDTHAIRKHFFNEMLEEQDPPLRRGLLRFFLGSVH